MFNIKYPPRYSPPYMWPMAGRFDDFDQFIKDVNTAINDEAEAAEFYRGMLLSTRDIHIFFTSPSSRNKSMKNKNKGYKLFCSGT